MATMTFQGTSPSAGGDINAAPITDTFNHIMSTWNGNNADENNVDYTSVDGIMVLGQAQTATAVKSWENVSAAAGGIREVAQFGIDPSSGTAADNDGGRLVFYADDDGGTETDIGRFDWVLTDASDGSEDSKIDLAVITNGTLANEVSLTGAALYPSTDDGLALGIVNSNEWSDLFLASGSVINFNNSDVTITHSANTLTFSGGSLVVGVDDTGYDVKLFGATSGQYLLWDESADELVLAGDTKLSFHDAAGGENLIASSDGHLEINAGTTLDITAPTVDLNSSTEFNIDTAAYDLNASGAVTVDSAGISLDSSAASNFTTSGGALTISGKIGLNLQEDGADIITINTSRAIATANTASIDLDASGAIAINSSGGTLSVGNDNVDQVVNLATAGTRTLNVGINDGTDVTTIVSKGNITNTGTVTVGVDDTGHDVQFFGATSGQYVLWDESADELILAGDTKLSFHDAAGGENIIASSDGHLEINAGTTLDITAPTVDLNSSTEFNIDTAAYDLNASGAVTVDSAGISLDSSTASNFTTSGGTLTLEGKTGLSLKEDGADVMVIDSDKLVTFPAVDEANAAFVIGHTAEHDDIFGETPQLQVVGNVGAGSGSIGLIRYESGTDGPYISFCRSDHDTIGTHALVDNGDKLGTISWHGSDGNDFVNQSAYIRAEVDGTGGNNEVPGSLHFATTLDGAASATEHMVIDSLGNVGIGIGAPITGGPFDATGRGLQIHDASGQNTATLYLTNGAAGATADDGCSLTQSGTDTYLTNWESANMYFQTGGATNRMSISSAGVVNISQLTASSDVTTDGSKNLVTSSDANLKNDLGEITDAIAKIIKIPARYFTWKNDTEGNAIPDQPRSAGFFAQEVYAAFPEGSPGGANIDGEGKEHWGLNSRAILGLILVGVKEIDARLKLLEAR